MNAALIIAETAICVMAIEPATRAYLAISKDRAARAKARRETETVTYNLPGFSLAPAVPSVTLIPPAGPAETAPGPAGSNGTAEVVSRVDPVTRQFVRADGGNKVLDKLRSGAS